MKTPTGVPASRSGTCPPSSSASQATSRSMRCWGSRIDRLAGRDAEEGGVEAVDVLAGIRRASGSRGSRSVPIVPARGRGRADRLAAVAEQLPERRGTAGPGEPAADADDRDRLAAAGPVRRRPARGRRRRRTRPRGSPPAHRSWDSRRPAWARASGRATPRARPRAAPPGASRCRSRPGARAESTSSGRMPSGSATLAASQAAIASARRASRARHRRDVRGHSRHAVAPAGRGVVLARPLRDGLERPGQERVAAGVAPDLAARGPGQARRLDQPDRGDLDVERLGDLAADRREDLLGRAPRRASARPRATIASRSSPSTSTAKAAAPPARSAGWQRSAAHSTSCG